MEKAKENHPVSVLRLSLSVILQAYFYLYECAYCCVPVPTLSTGSQHFYFSLAPSTKHHLSLWWGMLTTLVMGVSIVQFPETNEHKEKSSPFSNNLKVP
jgi:hypothetical protein